MKLRTFILMVSGGVMLILGLLLSWETRRILKTGFEQLDKTYRNDVGEIVLASLASKETSLRNYGQLLSLNFNLAGIFIVSKETHDPEMLDHSLERIRETSLFDMVDILDLKGSASRKLEMALAPQQIDEIISKRNGIAVALIGAEPTLIGISPLRLYDEVVGYMVLGFHLNRGIARELGETTRARIEFNIGPAGIAGPGGQGLDSPGAIPAKINAITGEPVTITLQVDNNFLSRMNHELNRNLLFFSTFLILFLVGLIYLWLELGFVRAFRRHVAEIDSASATLNQGRLPQLHLKGHGVEEINILAKSFNQFSQSLVNYDTREKQQAKIAAEAKTQGELAEMAQEVAHNIRSPLSALDMLLLAAENIPEETRLLVRGAISRIQETTSLLLEKRRKLARNSETIRVEDNRMHSLPALVDAVVSEKRLQLGKRPEIRFTYTNELAEPTDRVWVNANEFQAALSNLIDNAIEAISEQGEISLSVSKNGAHFQIDISDNGLGIPAGRLATLGNKGVSFGKTTGTGLGLFHARKTLEAAGGSFEIQSREGKGTRITLLVPIPDTAQS